MATQVIVATQPDDRKKTCPQSHQRSKDGKPLRVMPRSGVFKTNTKRKNQGKYIAYRGFILPPKSPLPKRHFINDWLEQVVRHEPAWKCREWEYKEAANYQIVNESQPQAPCRMRKNFIFNDDNGRNRQSSLTPEEAVDVEVGLTQAEWDRLHELATMQMPRTVPVFTKMGNPHTFMGHPGYGPNTFRGPIIPQRRVIVRNGRRFIDQKNPIIPWTPYRAPWPMLDNFPCV